MNKAERYTEIAEAVAGGDIKLVKFLFKLISKIEEVDTKAPDESWKAGITTLESKLETVNKLLTVLSRPKPPQQPIKPTIDELLALIRPLIPSPVPGIPGKTPTDKELRVLIEGLIPEPIPGPPGLTLRGIPGKDGKPPKHEWSGTRLRFQNPDGSWGDFVNLQGPVTEAVEWGKPTSPAPASITVRTPNGRLESVADINFGDGFSAIKTPNGVKVDMVPQTVTIKETVGITVDGSGQALAAGSKGFRYMNDAYTITGWHIISDIPGDIVMDVKKAGTSITGTEKPTLTADNEASMTTLTAWETEIISGDTLEFIIDSNVDITRVTLSILLTKA